MILTATEPDIIVLQETRGTFSKRGYNHFVEPSIRQKQRGTIVPNIPTMTTTYVRKSIPTIQIETAHINTHTAEHVATRSDIGQHTLDIVNCYWIPNQQDFTVAQLRSIQARPSRQRSTLLLGDFNSHHVAWGYTQTTSLGRKLDNLTSNQHFTLLNDTTQATRIGTAQEQDTIPDLTWIRSHLPATWENTQDSLGSDHYILEIQIQLRKKRGAPIANYRRTKIVNWPKGGRQLED